MEEYITPDRIANSIMQEGLFDGVYLLVEGAKDIKLYSRLVQKESVRLRQTHGKYKQRAVYAILTERRFDEKIAIRDADFLRIPGNVKFDDGYLDNIFTTDGHDSEVMVVSSSAFNDLVSVSCSEDKLATLERKMQCDIRSLVLNLAEPIGYLRLANKKFNLGLSFKPERAGGTALKFKKFVCDKKLSFIGFDELINTVYEYSRGRGSILKSRAEIRSKLDEIMLNKYPLHEIVNGHDLAEIMAIVLKKGLQSQSGLVQDSSSIEDALALAYGPQHFSKTNLYARIKTWQASVGREILLG